MKMQGMVCSDLLFQHTVSLMYNSKQVVSTLNSSFIIAHQGTLQALTLVLTVLLSEYNQTNQNDQRNNADNAYNYQRHYNHHSQPNTHQSTTIQEYCIPKHTYPSSCNWKVRQAPFHLEIMYTQQSHSS